MSKKSGLPRGVTRFQDRHENWHYRFRKLGCETHYFAAEYDSADFWEEYAACLKAEKKPLVATPNSRTPPGSISALIALYYDTPSFAGLRESTKTTYRGIIERFRVKYGMNSVKNLRRQDIRHILAAMKDTPSAANNLLDRLRPLMTLAVEEGWRDDDPTYRVTGFANDSDGYHSWSEDEIAAFERTHPIGSKPRLAFSLLLHLGQRRSDVVRMGWQHVSGSRIAVRQIKTNALLSIPMHAELQAVLAATPKDRLTFVMTEYGEPFTPAGFGNWFRRQCDAAGLPECSAHGLRKAAARRLAEAGCSNQEIKSITGHKTDKEVSRYTAAADQQRLSDSAMKRVGRTNRKQANG